MPLFCQYKDSLGKPGEGFHSVRFLNIAVLDTLLVVIATIIIKKFLPQYSMGAIFMVIFVIGIIVHRLFCVKTTIDKILFGDGSS